MRLQKSCVDTNPEITNLGGLLPAGANYWTFGSVHFPLLTSLCYNKDAAFKLWPLIGHSIVRTVWSFPTLIMFFPVEGHPIGYLSGSVQWKGTLEGVLSLFCPVEGHAFWVFYHISHWMDTIQGTLSSSVNWNGTL